MDFRLHAGQLQVFHNPARIKTLTCGRRFGKSRLQITNLVTRSLGFPGTVDPISTETVVGALPTLTQAIPILWEPLVTLFEGELKDTCARIDRTRHVIYPKYGKPPIAIVGANDKNGDRLRGKRIYYLAADEYQDWSPTIFDTVVRPAMADTTGSTALLTGTPKGKLNGLYLMHKRGLDNLPGYASFNLPTAANPTIPGLAEEIEAARLTLPEKLFNQEFLATFEDYPGKIYYSLSEANRCDEVPLTWDYTLLGVDWGDVNPAFTVWGHSGDRYYYLEGWQNWTGAPCAQPTQDAEIVRLASTYGVSMTLADPSRPSSILSLRALGQQHDIAGLRNAIAGYNPIEEGITQIHSLIYQGRLQFPRSVAYPERPGTVTPSAAYTLFESYRRASYADGTVSHLVEPGQDDHCLAGESLVTLIRGDVPISEVVAGDFALTRDGWKEVLWAGQTGTREVFEYTIGDHTLRSTPDHLVAVGAQWMPIDMLCGVHKEQLGVIEPVYNLHIKDTHEFIAQGVLVHNCADASRYALALKKGVVS